MKAFGLELRKFADPTSFYAEVDNVLTKYNVPRFGISQYAQRMGCAHALQKMMRADKYLDVCTIKECAVLCGVLIPSDRMLLYSTAHCIHWNEMLPDYCQMLMAMILDDFRPILNP